MSTLRQQLSELTRLYTLSELVNAAFMLGSEDYAAGYDPADYEEGEDVPTAESLFDANFWQDKKDLEQLPAEEVKTLLDAPLRLQSIR